MTDRGMQADLLSVGTLFADSSAYVVPQYQRNFAWRTEQIEQLLSDVWDAAREHPDDDYFLGNLIVRTAVKDPTRFEVIDGQQRLTTLYLVLSYLGGVLGDGQAHHGCVGYAGRAKAADALRRIDAHCSQGGRAEIAPPDHEDVAIHRGFKDIQRYIGREIGDEMQLRTFAAHLNGHVTLVRATLPDTTDLNRYFEIMNTRGQQLQQVDIVKARLMSHLANESEQACFGWIWDACTQMDTYVQMALAPGNTDLRQDVFGDDWTFLGGRSTRSEGSRPVSSFADLMSLRPPPGASAAGSDDSSGRDISTAIAHYASRDESRPATDPGERFRSVITFPAFLLHVLKVVRGDTAEVGGLDDKALIKGFHTVLDQLPADSRGEWVRSFGYALLKCRNLFDTFVVKRRSTSGDSEDGELILKRLKKEGRNEGPVNTFSVSGTSVDGEVDNETAELLLIESMLRVTYTAPSGMHWITRLLAILWSGRAHGRDLAALLCSELRDYARKRVKESYFDSDKQRSGFAINRIVFTYLDYLLLLEADGRRWHGADLRGFRFTRRNSIEHFYPQGRDIQQDGSRVSPECLNLLGNLALVSVGANSKFSNNLPLAKAETYWDTIVAQSPKLIEMAATAKEGDRVWGDAQVLDHHRRMERLLRKDLGIE